MLVPMLRVVRRPLRAMAVAVVGLTLLLALSGCGGVGQPAPYGPSGIDGIEVPVASPDPDDYVAVVDNPRLPLHPGSTWTYRVESGGELVRTIETTVVGETEDIAGVGTTVVKEIVTDLDGGLVSDAYAWYAQDRAGNVWLFGRDSSGRGAVDTSSWQAGVDGALAGLAMPAQPRVGDGFVREQAPGVAEDHLLVRSLVEARTTGDEAWDDLLEMEVTSPLDPAAVGGEYYAEGVGLVTRDGPTAGEVVELADFSTGSS